MGGKLTFHCLPKPHYGGDKHIRNNFIPLCLQSPMGEMHCSVALRCFIQMRL